MRVFQDFEKKYLSEFLEDQPKPEIEVIKLQGKTSKVLENYLTFNKSEISARLNCVYTDHVEQIKGNDFFSLKFFTHFLEILDCPMPPFVIFIGNGDEISFHISK